MQIVGEKVIHKAFGKGIVIDYKDDHISVYFASLILAGGLFVLTIAAVLYGCGIIG